ncbi:lysosome membrane protein 2 [Planoprotostelium fungivorum]|uniref:Lysosome membrane protein 2 n=1 Tax=Planoprotostelium fungivorum TaxID=1890364 RepID=A0A2P6N1N5_9EUKA|nr:lysosome membrane protein 2 [Planoprotostelium fungivorum]
MNGPNSNLDVYSYYLQESRDSLSSRIPRLKPRVQTFKLSVRYYLYTAGGGDQLWFAYLSSTLSQTDESVAISKMKYLGHISAAVLLLVGIILLALAIAAPPLVQKQIDEGLHQNLQLKKGSNTFDLWKNNAKNDSNPQYLNIRFLNITNPDEVLTGAKPKVVEVGPYVYRKNMIRFNEKLSADNNTVEFRTWTYYTFQENQSSGDPTVDNITTANLAYAGVQHQLGDDWYFNMVADILGSYQKNAPLITKTAQEHIWGYESEMLKFVKTLKPEVEPFIQIQPNETSYEDNMRTRKTDIINTGHDDINKVLQFVKFQNMTMTSFWNSEKADTVRGTDGSQFHPNLDMNSILEPWVDDAFRTLKLTARDHVTVQGVNLLRFRPDITNFDNSTLFPSNAEYYQNGPSGVGNLTSIFKAPVFFSNPHFFGAPHYAEAIEGLSPESEKHETYLDIEPTTGLTMNVAKRSQISVRVTPTLLRYPLMRTTYIPVVWMELRSQLTEKSADQFQESNSLIVEARGISKALKYIGWSMGAVCLTISLLLIAVISRRAIRQRRGGYSAIK